MLSEEPFFAHVEDGKLVVGNKEEGHVLIDVSIDHIYEDFRMKYRAFNYY